MNFNILATIICLISMLINYDKINVLIILGTMAIINAIIFTK